MPKLRWAACVLAVVCLFALPAAAQTISFISDPSAVGSGLQSGTIRARLSDSQHGGVFVTLTSTDSLTAWVAPDADSSGSPSLDVFVPNGSIDARFVVQGLEGVTGLVTIEASAPGFATDSFSVDIQTPYYRISSLSASTNVPSVDDAFTVRVGVSASPSSSLTSQQTRAGGPGLSVDVSVDDVLVGELVTDLGRGSLVNVSIAPGESASPSSVSAGGVAFDGIAAGLTTVSAQITGLLAQDAATQVVTVNPAAITWIGVPANVGSGLRTSNLRARLNGPAHGGVIVELRSLDPSRVLSAEATSDTGAATLQVFVPDGSIDANFRADGIEGTTGAVTVDASAPGFETAVGSVEVLTPFVTLSGLGSAQDTLDPPDLFRAAVGISFNGSTVTQQDLRVGGPGLDVTFSVDDSTLALLETTSARNDTLTLTIPPDESGTPSTFGNGGIQLDGIAAGSVTVAVTAPGFAQTSNAQRVVSVTQPSLSFIGLPGKVGAGLVTSSKRARLGASQHGGTTVRVEVADSTLALVSLTPGDPGSRFVEGFVPNGSIDLIFYAHGLESVVDTVQITATAPQFQPATVDLDVVVPAVRVSALGSSLDTAAGVDPFYATLGIANAGGSSLSGQSLRPGSAGLDVTFTLSDSTVAQLVTTSTTGGSQTLPVAPGDNTTPTSLATGGLALDGILPGLTVVSVRAPGYAAIPIADKTVTINAPGISWIGAGSKLGAGLQSNLQRARLSGSLHGGVTVRVESGDPARLLVSTADDVVGSAFVEVFVPDGSIDAFFYSQALEGVTGTVDLTATAPGFTTSTSDMEIVTPAVDISGLASTLSVGAAPDPFTVRVGVPNGSGTSVSPAQNVRAGAPPLAVTVSSNDGAVVELVTLAGSGSSREVLIPSGDSSSAFTIAAGGAGARGLGGGTALIEATVPGFVVVGSGQREVTVASTGISLAGVPAFLGARLQTPVLTAQLDDPNHGGVTLTIASDDTNRVLVAPDPFSPGAASVELPLSNGIGSAQYVLQGREGGTGSATVTASAGIAAGSVNFEVVEPALQLVGVPDSLEVIDPDAVFQIQTGVAAAGGDSLAQRQVVRTGAGPLGVSVVNALVSTGDLVTSALQADSVVVDVLEVSDQSAPTVNGGGVAFTPSGAGTTILSASAPGFATTTRGAFNLVVFGDATSAPGALRRLALQPNVPNPFNPSTLIRFSLPEPGPVELRVLDLRGRHVRSLVSGQLESGDYEIEWNGDDDQGRPVASESTSYAWRRRANNSNARWSW